MKAKNPIILREGTPSTPPAGHVALYSTNGSALLMKDDTGAVTTFGGSSETTVVLGSDFPTTSSTLANVTNMSAALTPGTYVIEGLLIWTSTVTTTGIEFRLKEATNANYSRLIYQYYGVSTGTTATTGVHDDQTTLTAQMLEGKVGRAGIAPGPTQGAATTSQDIMFRINGQIVVTANLTLDLQVASEVNTTSVSLKSGTVLTYKKIV